MRLGRRAWMAGLAAASVVACDRTPEAAPRTGPLSVWEPVDPAFAGCQASCGAHADGPVAGVVAQPGALPGDRTFCPVSGALFEIDPEHPRIEIAGGTLWFCCRACFGYFREHRDEVLAARGLITAARS